uniref:Ig-like domain-containing protein n=1 Tax=Denticeps clupeoides TaxID=299321 RepID=A0AAY4DGV1_9TELE
HQVLWLLCSFYEALVNISSDTRVHQGQRTVSSLLGGSVTLPCYFNLKSPLRMFWFKHVPGHEIKLIVSSFYNRVSFEEEVNKSKLDAETSDKSFNLTLKSIEASDEGSYLCGVNWNSKYYFGNGVFLFIKASLKISFPFFRLLHTSEGHNVTLNCTVVCGGCAGEHSVYWFRHGTPGSHPGIIYTHGDRSAGCEKNPEAGSSTQSCVYHLPKRNLSTTDAGTYHCAVAACSNGSGVTALIVTVIISVTANIALVLLWRKALRAGLHFILFLDDLLQMFSHFTKEKQIISRICDEQTCWVFTFLHFIYIF